MFPTINHISDLLPYIQDNKQIRVKEDETTGHTVVCYMLQDEDTFSGPNKFWEQECRGITFFSNGKIAARTLTKFFNVGEAEASRVENIDWTKVNRVMVKRDGSMVTPVLKNLQNVPLDAVQSFTFKTKKTFSSAEAMLAGEICAGVPGGHDYVLRLLKAGLTPTFEVTSPRFPIVLKYEKDELTLLHVRENISGRYLSSSEMVALGSPFAQVEDISDTFMSSGVPRLISPDLLQKFMETATQTEGVVIQFDNGDMVKWKTLWYVELHRSVTFTRWRDIARTVCSDSSDDLKAAFTMVGRDIEPILTVERRVREFLETVQVEVEAVVKKYEGQTPKDIALAERENPYFGLIMKAFRGAEADYMGYYVKNNLEEEWGLEVVS